MDFLLLNALRRKDCLLKKKKKKEERKEEKRERNQLFCVIKIFIVSFNDSSFFL